MKEEAKKISNAAAGALFLHLAATIAVRVLHGGLTFTLDASDMIYNIISSMLVLCIAYFSFNAFCKRMGCSHSASSRREHTPISDTAAIILICGPSIFLIGKVYSSLFSDNASAYIPQNDGIYEYLLAFILYVVVPVFFEELVFRYCFAREFRIFGSVGAIILSSLLFGLTHFSFSAFPYAFICGIILAAAYYITGRPSVPLAIHFINNAAGFASAIIYRYSADAKKISTATTIIAVALVAVGLALLLLGGKRKRRAEGEEEHALAADALTPAMTLYLLCAVAVHVFM